MTRAEIRIAAAEKRAEAAAAALRRAYDARNASVDAACAKHRPRVWRAEAADRAARCAVTVAKLASIGITPMETIIQWKGRRFVVRVTREGWRRLVPVGKKGARLKDRVEIDPPWRWSDVTVTGDTMKTETAG